MRIIGRFPDQRQVGAFVDSAKNIGFDRKDMIITDLAKEQHWSTIEEAAEDITLVKTETDDAAEIKTFADGIKGLDGEVGLIVSVKTPKHSGDKVRNLMEQSGAVEVIQE